MSDNIATLTQEDLAGVIDLLKLRAVQFCMFVMAIVGAEKMERIMLQAIATAKRLAHDVVAALVCFFADLRASERQGVNFMAEIIKVAKQNP